MLNYKITHTLAHPKDTNILNQSKVDPKPHKETFRNTIKLKDSPLSAMNK